MALVFDEKGAWTGLVTLEDVIEEIVVDVGDEFQAPSMELPALTPARITMGVEAESLEEAVIEILACAPAREIGLSPVQRQNAVRDAANSAPSYHGHGITTVAVTISLMRQPLARSRLLEGALPRCCHDSGRFGRSAVDASGRLNDRK